MKVFLSWSGPVSKQVALALRDWLPSVIQAIKPWASAEDIEKGSRWSSELAVQLQETKAGIICVTPDNQTAPWLHFEAGALSKSVSHEMVCPYLFRVKPSNLTGPLAQFQATDSSKEDTKKLVFSLNKGTSNPLSDAKMAESFEKWWVELESKLSSIVMTTPDHERTRGTPDMVEELLTLGRDQSRTLQLLLNAVAELERRNTLTGFYAAPAGVWPPSGILSEYDSSAGSAWPKKSSSNLAFYNSLLHTDTSGMLEPAQDFPEDSLGDEPDPEKPVIPE